MMNQVIYAISKLHVVMTVYSVYIIYSRAFWENIIHVFAVYYLDTFVQQFIQVEVLI